MTKRTNIKPSSEFYWGALSMKSAMLAAVDAHAENIQLGFPPELVIAKLKEHMELISADMVANTKIAQNIGDFSG